MLKYSTRLIILAFIGAICLGGCSKESNPSPPPAEGDDMESIDEMVYRYMSQNSVPGATLAVARNGKLVYAKAYGFADRETGQRMTTSTRSRISSVSKSITAIAIMKLLEEGKLALDDKIFGDEGILAHDFGSRRPYRPHITSLTVKHCLSHHVGGWGNASNDPTMMQNHLDAPQLISYIIDNVALSNAPGTSYAYSNVGFMILGRVIEKVSGKSYEQYVQDEILNPIGITGMEIGGNTLDDKKPNESTYHHASAYTRNFSRRDANGGWIATATDLARLLVHVDGSSSVPDILQNETIQTMTTPPFSYRQYALGFNISGNTWSHGGSFSGSRSHWMRTGSGFSAAIMVNGDASNIQTVLTNIVSASVEWPDQDLF